MAGDEFDFTSINFGKNGGDDPEPKKTPFKKTGTSTGRPVGRPPGRPSKQSKLSEVQAELEQLLKFGFMPVLFKDHHFDDAGNQYSCADVVVEMDPAKGVVLTDQGKQMAAAMAGIVIDSAFLMKMLDAGDIFGKYTALVMAMMPLASTVFNNHMRKAIPNVSRESQMG
jgi:hypothetical protein